MREPVGLPLGERHARHVAERLTKRGALGHPAEQAMMDVGAELAFEIRHGTVGLGIGELSAGRTRGDAVLELGEREHRAAARSFQQVLGLLEPELTGHDQRDAFVVPAWNVGIAGEVVLDEMNQLMGQGLPPSRVRHFEQDDPLTRDGEPADPVSTLVGTLVSVEEIFEPPLEVNGDRLGGADLQPTLDGGPLFAHGPCHPLATRALPGGRVDEELGAIDLKAHRVGAAFCRRRRGLRKRRGLRGRGWLRFSACEIRRAASPRQQGQREHGAGDGANSIGAGVAFH